ncbi:hypothetical protein GTW69_38590 [Streptomyces sp. SID7760]|nr:hypothetical protein [Streptomyces sp. SID7760]
MRIRLTDGTRRIDIQTSNTPLADVEAIAIRLLAAMPHPPQDPPDTPHPIGFTPDLHGVSLDSTTERADPEPDTCPDPDDGEGRA